MTGGLTDVRLMKNHTKFAQALMVVGFGCADREDPPTPPDRPPVIERPDPDSYDAGEAWIEDEW